MSPLKMRHSQIRKNLTFLPNQEADETVLEKTEVSLDLATDRIV